MAFNTKSVSLRLDEYLSECNGEAVTLIPPPQLVRVETDAPPPELKPNSTDQNINIDVLQHYISYFDKDESQI